MIAKDILTNSIVPLKTSDTGTTAMGLMEDMKVLHLPIVNNEQYLGMVSQSDILNLNAPEEALGNHDLSIDRSYVFADQNIFEIIRLISALNLTLLPVLDRKNNYLGVITLPDLVKKFAKITSADNPGGIIILEVNNNDYSLTEISNIIESNDAKVLSLCVTTYTDSTKLEISIKLNKIDLRSVLQTFNRYNYKVVATFFEQEDNDILKERFDSLMNYLNI